MKPSTEGNGITRNEPGPSLKLALVCSVLLAAYTVLVTWITAVIVTARYCH